ncbi:MAG: DUF2158 domain-containing protein [Verrucomicrobia bacterium]|jgi:uncharacterized protein YodC (DUF2158 family)|nr:DUF2158 domain-containing protein [Verrucomicrobiota bacterium]
MKYKPGDIVIKTTGGNKMTVYERISDRVYRCLWFVENSYKESNFYEHEIVTLTEWKRFLKTEEREDKINQLLG